MVCHIPHVNKSFDVNGMIDLTQRTAPVHAEDEGIKMGAHEPLSNLYNNPPTMAVNWLVLNGTHDSTPAQAGYICFSHHVIYCHSFSCSKLCLTREAHNLGYKWESQHCGKGTFVIAAHDGVTTRGHADPNGATTAVHCLMGVKFWAVRTGPPINRKDKLHEDNIDFAGWQVYVLLPGDTLCVNQINPVSLLNAAADICMNRYMSPGTAHAVRTVATSICRGSFFYPYCSYKAALLAIVEEHISGLTLTNTSDPALTANFFRLWTLHERTWREHEKKGSQEKLGTEFFDALIGLN